MTDTMIFLNQSNFCLEKKGNKSIMKLNLDGESNRSDLSIVLFYNNRCEFCGEMIEAFNKAIVHCFNSVNFCLLNVDKNPGVVVSSLESSTPLTYVPFVMFYYKGYSHTQYTGLYDKSHLMSFIKAVIDDISNGSHINTEFVEKKKNVENICSIGKPLIGKGKKRFCSYTEAY